MGERSTVHRVDPFVDFNAERTRILSSQRFETLVEQIVNQSLQALDSKEVVDDALGRRCLNIAARFAILGLTGRGSATELAFAREIIEGQNERLAIPMLREGRVAMVAAPGARPWEAVLTRSFARGAFGHKLRPFPAGRVARERSVLLAIEFILEEVCRAVTTPPRPFSEALAALGETKDVAKLPKPARDHVTEAVEWMMKLLLPHPTDGVTLGIAYRKREGRASRRFVTPWGATVRFAKCFGLIMPPRAHDVTRAR